MNVLQQFWNEHCDIDRPLESDSLLRHLLNRYIVAALMNTFPNAATRFLSMSRGELARLLFVERDGGSFRSLRAMYEYEDPQKRGDLLNRVIMQSPAIKAARNRRRIAQRMLQSCLEALPKDRPTLVLAIGGGDGNLEADVIARIADRDIYYCVVDKDARAAEENHKVLVKHGLENRGFVYVGTVVSPEDMADVIDNAKKRFGVPFNGAGVTVCHGITEYYDIGSESNETLGTLLKAIHCGTCSDGSLIISQTDYHDRVQYLERGLSWYMRLRSLEEVDAEVEKAGWQISVCEHEPMRLITMCLAVKSEAKHRRIDSPSQSRQIRTRGQVRATVEQRELAENS